MGFSAITFVTLFLLHSSTILIQVASQTPKPKALVLPIRQDATTKLLVANIYGRTPLTQVGFVVDLTAQYLWANCETNYKSSTFSEPKCGSAQCKQANTSYCFTCLKASRPFCHSNTCGRLVENPSTHQSTIGEVAQDVIALRSTDGSNPGPMVFTPNFLFTCSPSALVENGLPNGVQGVVGLAEGPIALHNQLASRLGLKPMFTMCIPSTTSANGVIFFGSDGPYNFLPGIDGSTNLIYTPLTISPLGEYSINIKSIKVNQKNIPINQSLLSVNDIGTGGTIFNTILPYTILEGSIFKALTSSFAKEVSNARPVKPISPFELCYESKNFPSSRLGPIGPSIDLELDGQGATWSIFGLNSFIEAQPGVLCLAFVNGGSEYRASVNIGTYQLKDIPMQFDLSRSRLGIGYPLAGLRTHCENFNFTASV